MATKRDNAIELVAQLDKKTSKEIIIANLNDIARQINNDPNFNFQIKVSLDQRSLSTMKSQLASVFSNLTVKTAADIVEQTSNNSKKGKYDNINTVKGETTDETLARAKAELNAQLDKTGDKVTRVTKAYENANGALQQFYVQVERQDKSIATLTYGITKQGDAFKYLGETIREADNSTDMRRKDLGTQWDIQAENLNKFIANAQRAGVAEKELAADIAELQNMMARRNEEGNDNTNYMNQFLDKFDIAKAKLQAFNAEMRKDNAAQAHSNRIQKLSADMKAFAAANERAVKSNKEMSNGMTFAQKWAELSARMANSANMTESELKKLNAEFRIFGKEAEAAGLKGESALGKFLNSFKVISTYFSASRLISLAVREIRSAITELQTLDDRLTEISKTSDRTDASLRRLGENSFDVASKYGRTASDYLLGVQEMSRAGFGEAESEKLAELSILAQSAGDMTAEMANEYIIATNAAYSLAGNSEKLNKVLDSQNYITNHNAVSMENLAQATKLAASQAAASGVEIDELTAAVGTMVAVTQQGGDQAGRAFKGILMNIQQVKASAADIGDGGEDITAESLSKYEKATAALGVSLKEVKNGTVQLRKPMEVLRDLAIAVNKEGENSVKVANLISAVGGKFRGNQLIALLQNWETYEKMLSEYNSDDAIDSAFKESQKSANNWAGSINKVKNSWTEFVNVFINSDNMKEMLNTINEIIQNFTDSAVSGGLKITFDLLNKILKVIEFLTEQLGTLGTVALPLIMKFTTLHKLDLWSSIKSQLTATIPVIQATTLEYEKLYQAELLAADTRNYFTSNANGASMLTGAVATPFTASAGVDYAKATNDVQTYSTKYSVAVSSMEKSSKSASSAVGGLVTALRNFAIIAVVTFAIKKASEYIDSYNIDAEESARKTSEVVAELTELKSALDNLKEEKDTLNNILQSYGEVVSKTQSTAEKKEALAKIQKDLNDLYGTEAKGIDVVNGKYDDQIKKIDKLQKDKEEKFKKEHAADIAQAQAMSSLYMGEEDFTLYTDGYDLKKGDYKYSYDTVKRINEDSLEAIYVLDELDQAAVKAAKDIEGIYYGSYTGFKSGNNHRLYLSGDIKEAREQMELLLDEYSKLQGDERNQKVFEALQERYNALVEAVKLIEEMSPYLERGDVSGVVLSTTDAIVEGVNAVTEATKTTIVSSSELKKQWLANLDDMQKGSLKNISTMVSALQDLSENKGINANTFWSLIEFDDDGLLGDAKLVGDKFYVDQEKMIELKDKYIQKQIESIKQDTIQVATQKLLAEEQANQLQAKVLDMVQTKKYISNPEAYNELQGNLNDAKETAKAYNEQWQRNLQLIGYLNQALGDTVDRQKELENQQKQLNKELTALNKELNNVVKAHEHVIDSIIDKLETEQHELENQKQTLEDELDVLEKQKDTIEETIKKYDSVNDLVQNTIQKEIDALEEQKKAIEDTYNARIDALKAENEEREDALEYAQKLANLENAKNNKVRVIDSTRGFRYESVREDVANAQNDLFTFENNRAVKALEQERDQQTKSFDEIIKTKEEYAKRWKEISQNVQDAESELLAEEILGGEWRQLIADGDIEIMQKFTDEYSAHNTELKRLTDTEIKYKKEAIDAKNKEIEAKKQQITAWKDYKREVSNAVTELQRQQEDYYKLIGQIELTEKSSLTEREKAFGTFVNNITGIIEQIGQKQNILDNVTSTLDSLGDKSFSVDFSVIGMELLREARDIIDGYSGRVLKVLSAGEVFRIMKDQNFDNIGDVVKYLREGGLSEGGVTDYTGLVQIHGRKNAPEVTFNTNDAKKLYEYVHHSPNLIADNIKRATSLSGFKLSNNSNSRTSSVNIGAINVYANNFEELDRGLDRHLDQYFRNKLTEGYTNKQ